MCIVLIHPWITFHKISSYAHCFIKMAIVNILSLQLNLLNKSWWQCKERHREKKSHLLLPKRVSFCSLCICSFHHCDTSQVSSTHSCYLQNSYKARKENENIKIHFVDYTASHIYRYCYKKHDSYLEYRWML